jgi:hypothetical protein
MGYPNQYCGECGYWLAFGEPETTEEENAKIVEHCAHCPNPCGIVDEEYFKIINSARLQILLRKLKDGDI